MAKRSRSRRPPIPSPEIKALWDQVPSIACQGKCSRSCGPIAAGQEEEDLLERRSGKPLDTRADGMCIHLSANGSCKVYSIRPLICRLWGVVESMPCPWGCKPERVMSDEEGFLLMAQTFADDEDEARSTQAAIRRMHPDDRKIMQEWISTSGDLQPDAPRTQLAIDTRTGRLALVPVEQVSEPAIRRRP